MPEGDADPWNTPHVPNTWSPDERQESSEWPRMRTWDMPEDPNAFMQSLTGEANPSLRTCLAALDNFCSHPPCIPMPAALQAALTKAGLLRASHLASMAALRAQVQPT